LLKDLMAVTGLEPVT